jgi:hypothetical protein
MESGMKRLVNGHIAAAKLDFRPSFPDMPHHARDPRAECGAIAWGAAMEAPKI